MCIDVNNISIYTQARQLISIAEESVDLSAIAALLAEIKAADEREHTESGMMLLVAVPLKVGETDLADRYPLEMVKPRPQWKEVSDIHHRKAAECAEIAASWSAEQRLRRLGYKTRTELCKQEVD